MQEPKNIIDFKEQKRRLEKERLYHAKKNSTSRNPQKPYSKNSNTYMARLGHIIQFILFLLIITYLLRSC